MATKVFLPLIVAAITLSGCTTTARLSHRDIEKMPINCERKEEQLAFVRSQFPSPSDQFLSGLMVTSTLGFLNTHRDGTYKDRMDLLNGVTTNSIRIKIEQIEQVCARYELSRQR